MCIVKTKKNNRLLWFIVSPAYLSIFGEIYLPCHVDTLLVFKLVYHTIRIYTFAPGGLLSFARFSGLFPTGSFRLFAFSPTGLK